LSEVKVSIQIITPKKYCQKVTKQLKYCRIVNMIDTIQIQLESGKGGDGIILEKLMEEVVVRVGMYILLETGVFLILLKYHKQKFLKLRMEVLERRTKELVKTGKILKYIFL